uniref:Uncharacterized protein n=1 Tax=Amphimedon queenslandica TaxID=400682 RepID=A0A1X7UPF7_AMPQE
ADEFMEESKLITDTGVNLLQLRATNILSTYALQLMDNIFTDEEMSSSVYEASKRSTKPASILQNFSTLKNVKKNWRTRVYER